MSKAASVVLMATNPVISNVSAPTHQVEAGEFDSCPPAFSLLSTHSL
jgi:hypothetical protein